MRKMLLALALAGAVGAGSREARAEEPAIPANATIEGVLQKSCASLPDQKDCEDFYYIDLPAQLSEVVLKTKVSPTCAEGEESFWCARSVQVFDEVEHRKDLPSNVGQTVRVQGSLMEAYTAHHHRPALMSVEKLDVLSAPAKKTKSTKKPTKGGAAR